MNKSFAATACAALLLVCLLPAPAGADALLRCGESKSCAEHRVDFGAATITCQDENILQTSKWVCGYELEYECRLEGSNETHSGGIWPGAAGLCSHLCGKCPEGWK